MSFDDTCPQCGYPAYAGTCLECGADVDYLRDYQPVRSDPLRSLLEVKALLTPEEFGKFLEGLNENARRRVRTLLEGANGQSRQAQSR